MMASLIRRKDPGQAWETEVDTGDGGSQPSDDTPNGAILSVRTRPDFDAVLAVTPALLAMGWTAEFDYAAALGTQDGVQYLKPSGTANVFGAEVFPASLSSTEEPDWDADAPNLGDTITDGDITWRNGGPFASFPPTPTAWEASTDYTFPAMVWPVGSNGHLYLMFPTAPMTSDVTEPAFPEIFGTYISDNDGYWMDGGAADGDAVADWRTTAALLSINGQPDWPILNIIERAAHGNDAGLRWFREAVAQWVSVWLDDSGSGEAEFFISGIQGAGGVGPDLHFDGWRGVRFGGTTVIFDATTLLLGDRRWVSGTADPTAGAGVPASIGSLYSKTDDGSQWSKTGAGDTAWEQLAFA